MRRSRAGSWGSCRVGAVDSIVLVGLFLTAVAPGGALSSSEGTGVAGPRLALNASETTLFVDPPSYWLRTGANVTLRAAWSVLSPLCTVSALWYRWSVNGPNATGYLNTTTGPSATFSAAAFASGTTTVDVGSGAVLACGVDQEVITRTGAAELSTDVPLTVSAVRVTPDPLLPGQNATLAGTVEGGEPPYSLDVAWGDGARTLLTVPEGGPFSTAHPFPVGEFTPTVLVGDATGNVVNVSAEEPVSAESGLAVGIAPSAPAAEVGVPTDFEGVVDGSPRGSVPLFDCSNATVGPGTPAPDDPNDTEFSCTFTSPGTAAVVFGVYPTAPGEPTASVVLEEAVSAPPELSVDPAAPPTEVGETSFLRVGLADGVLPVSLSWNLSGLGSSESTSVASDGTGVIPVVPAAAGSFVVGVRAMDALGAVAVNDTVSFDVAPDLEANATGVSSLLAGGAEVSVAGVARSGCAPFTWWVVPDLLTTNDSAPGGSLPEVGEFVWNGTYAREGNLSITTGIADACGAAWQETLELALVPLLAITASVEPGAASPNETLDLNLSIVGGLAPFRLQVAASDGESWNGSVTSDGVSHWSFATDGNGSVRVGVTVEDSLGDLAASNATVSLEGATGPSGPPSSAPPSPPTLPLPLDNSSGSAAPGIEWLIVPFGVSVGGAAVLCVVWRWRSGRRRVAPISPDPVATLRRIIEPAEGAERFTVELLAEEAGIPLTTVRSTLNRLVSEGKVRSENGADGEEVLSWSTASGR